MRASAGRAGMTMVETLLAVFLGASVLLGLSYVYGFGSRMWELKVRQIAVQEQGTAALGMIAEAVAGASAFSEPSQGQLLLTIPAAPQGVEPSPARTIAIRHRQERLERDGRPFIPAFAGDSAVGVADFDVEERRDAAGIAVLWISLKLFTRTPGDMPSDTMAFETQAYPRNRGAGL